jgi:ankyrin repeat protein
MSLDASSISKINPLDSTNSNCYEDIKTYFDNRNFSKVETELIEKILFLKRKVIEKPHLNQTRKELKKYFNFLVEISNQDPTRILPEIKKNNYKIRPFRMMKALFMDNLIENEWKKQCIGKYGGEKKVDLSWKDWYLKNEYEVETLEGIETKMKWSVENGHLNYFKYLLSHESAIKLDDIKFDNNMSLLSKMIIEDYCDFCNYLMELNIDLNCIDNRGWRPLHYAVFYGNLKIVETLIEKKVLLNSKDKFGLTPVHIASIKGYTDILKCLLKNGAKVNFKDENGHSPVSYSVIQNEYSAVETLLNYGCDLTIKDKFGRGLLHLVSILGFSNLISLLLKNNMNVNLKDNFGKTPLHYSAQCRNLACQDILIKNYANVSVVDKFNDTPMLIAAFFGNTQEMSLLYEMSSKTDNY